MLPGDLQVWRSFVLGRALDAREAYVKALAEHRATVPQTEIGYRLYVLDNSVQGTRDVVAERGRHVIIGRHTRCDVVLPEHDAISLRHVLVRATTLDDGMPVLTVRDLDSTDGFELSDGSKQRSIVGSGPLVFRIGTHSIVALPSTGKLPDTLDAPLVDRVDGGAHRVIAQPESFRMDEHGPRSSRITIIGGTAPLSDRAPLPFLGDARPSNARRYEIALEASGRRAAVRVSDRDVEHGILIGRAHKCVDAGLRAILNNGVSRVHLLLVRETEGVFAYDIASTNGTFRDGHAVRCTALEDDGVRLRLNGYSSLRLFWRAILD
jgi:pSer/pThr/pTyr-binding forkhead associated (FHA) protein